MPRPTLTRRITNPIHRNRLIMALGVSLLLGCDGDPTRHSTEVPDVTTAMPLSSPTSMAEVSTMTLTLPFSGTVSSSGPAFHVNQTGFAHAGKFENSNSGSVSPALEGLHWGTGPAVKAWQRGKGFALWAILSNTASTSSGLSVESSSIGAANHAPGMHIKATNTGSTFPAANITASGKAAALNLNHIGTSGGIATFQSGGVNKARINKAGKGFFNGGTQTGGADLAEAFEVEGKVGAYQPGDVLAISERSDRTVEKSAEPYSTRVVGVYATKPGVLLTERDIDASLDDMVPVGVVGVIPTKVTAENGAIRRGDLLVSAGTPGHAMRGTERDRMLGAVLGKALAEFRGPGSGTIRVLVNVK